MTTPAARRLFFALWPDEDLRARMSALARALAAPCRGKDVPADNLHITLVFLGDVAEDRVPCLELLADAVSGERFDLPLDQLGFFPRVGVVWLGPTLLPAALDSLYEQLSAGLARCGLVPETRPYRPHVTLLRKARRGPPADVQVSWSWPVDHFVLVESTRDENGSCYRVLRRWPLRGEHQPRG